MNSPTAGLAALSFGSGISRGATDGSSGGVVSSPTNANSSGASIVAPSSPPPIIQYMPKGIESQIQAKMEGWATALTASGQGLLFENDLLQIILRQEFHGHQGNLQLLYKNVGNLPLESFGATASSTTIGVMIQASAPAATGLAPGDQTSQSMRVVCMEPFTTGPSVVVEFTSSQPDLMPGIAAKYTYPIPLPITILNFTFGLEMDRATFLSQWQSITVPEVMDTFRPPKSTVAAADAVGTLLTRSFHLKLVRDLCQRNEQMQVLTLAGSLETGTLSPAGKQLRVGALVRLEQSFKGSAYRLTVRAVHPTCAMAIFRAIKQQLLVL